MSAAFCQRKLLLQQKLQNKFEAIKTFNNNNNINNSPVTSSNGHIDEQGSQTTTFNKSINKTITPRSLLEYEGDDEVLLCRRRQSSSAGSCCDSPPLPAEEAFKGGKCQSKLQKMKTNNEKVLYHAVHHHQHHHHKAQIHNVTANLTENTLFSSPNNIKKRNAQNNVKQKEGDCVFVKVTAATDLEDGELDEDFEIFEESAGNTGASTSSRCSMVSNSNSSSNTNSSVQSLSSPVMVVLGGATEQIKAKNAMEGSSKRTKYVKQHQYQQSSHLLGSNSSNHNVRSNNRRKQIPAGNPMTSPMLISNNTISNNSNRPIISKDKSVNGDLNITTNNSTTIHVSNAALVSTGARLNKKERFSSCHDLRVAVESPSWFFPNITRDGSEALLTLAKEYGNVLVRKSTSYDGNHVVSARYDCKGVTEIRHYEITSFCFDSGEKKYLLRVIGQHPMLDSLESVLEYFLKINPGMRALNQDSIKHISWKQLLGITVLTNESKDNKISSKNTQRTSKRHHKENETKNNMPHSAHDIVKKTMMNKTKNSPAKHMASLSPLLLTESSISEENMTPTTSSGSPLLNGGRHLEKSSLVSSPSSPITLNEARNQLRLQIQDAARTLRSKASETIPITNSNNSKSPDKIALKITTSCVSSEDSGGPVIVTPHLLKPSMFKGEKSSSINTIIRRKIGQTTSPCAVSESNTKKTLTSGCILPQAPGGDLKTNSHSPLTFIKKSLEPSRNKSDSPKVPNSPIFPQTEIKIASEITKKVVIPSLVEFDNSSSSNVRNIPSSPKTFFKTTTTQQLSTLTSTATNVGELITRENSFVKKFRKKQPPTQTLLKSSPIPNTTITTNSTQQPKLIKNKEENNKIIVKMGVKKKPSNNVNDGNVAACENNSVKPAASKGIVLNPPLTKTDLLCLGDDTENSEPAHLFKQKKEQLKKVPKNHYTVINNNSSFNGEPVGTTFLQNPIETGLLRIDAPSYNFAITKQTNNSHPKNGGGSSLIINNLFDNSTKNNNQFSASPSVETVEKNGNGKISCKKEEERGDSQAKMMQKTLMNELVSIIKSKSPTKKHHPNQQNSKAVYDDTSGPGIKEENDSSIGDQSINIGTKIQIPGNFLIEMTTPRSPDKVIKNRLPKNTMVVNSSSTSNINNNPSKLQLKERKSINNMVLHDSNNNYCLNMEKH